MHYIHLPVVKCFLIETENSFVVQQMKTSKKFISGQVYSTQQEQAAAAQSEQLEPPEVPHS